MLTIDRRRDILRHLEANGSAHVTQLARVLGVSLSTVRRDLDDLADAGDVERVRGGAVRVGAAERGTERAASERALAFAHEKGRIAAAAVGKARAGDTVFISGGTTTERLIPLLRGVRSLTVITNAVNVAYGLADLPSIETIVLGGYLRHGERTLLGGMAEQAVCQFQIDTAFYGCYGIDAEVGLSGASLQESSMDRQVIAAADRLVVLADRSKFTQRGPVRLAEVARISTLVTDERAPADAIARLAEQGVEIVRA